MLTSNKYHKRWATGANGGGGRTACLLPLCLVEGVEGQQVVVTLAVCKNLMYIAQKRRDFYRKDAMSGLSGIEASAVAPSRFGNQFGWARPFLDLTRSRLCLRGVVSSHNL